MFTWAAKHLYNQKLVPKDVCCLSYLMFESLCLKIKSDASWIFNDFDGEIPSFHGWNPYFSWLDQGFPWFSSKFRASNKATDGWFIVYKLDVFFFNERLHTWIPFAWVEWVMLHFWVLELEERIGHDGTLIFAWCDCWWIAGQQPLF